MGDLDENAQSGNDGNDGGAINPAWNDLLGAVPEEYHEAITPHLSQWDKGVQQRFQQVQSEWSDYGFLKENEISPEDTRIALGLLRAVQEDPENFYNSLAESYGFGNSVEENGTSPEGENGSDQGGADLSGLPPEVMQKLQFLEQGYNTMAQMLIERQQQDEQTQQDNDLQKEIAGLKQTHGNFDERYVLTQMQNGASPEDAVKAYQDLVEQIKQENARPPAPRLLGSNSGGIPGEKRIDPTKLSPGETKNLVAEYLKAHNAASG